MPQYDICLNGIHVASINFHDGLWVIQFASGKRDLAKSLAIAFQVVGQGC